MLFLASLPTEGRRQHLPSLHDHHRRQQPVDHYPQLINYSNRFGRKKLNIAETKKIKDDHHDSPKQDDHITSSDQDHHNDDQEKNKAHNTVIGADTNDQTHRVIVGPNTD